MDSSRMIAYGTVVVIISLLFGLYTTLFVFSLRVLHRRKPESKVHLVTAVMLYVLSSISSVIEVALAIHALAYGETETATVLISESLTYLLFAMANTVADLLLLFRCYLIWTPRESVVLIPAIVSLISNAFHFIWGGICFYWNTTIAEHDKGNYKAEEVSSKLWIVAFGLTLASTLLLTGMIVGRIWWIRRQAAAVGPEADSSLRNRYHAVLAILIESGLLYLVCLMVFYAYGITPQLSGVWINTYTIPTQVAGIAPTLIIVRVGNGISVDSIEQTLEMLYRDHPATANRSVGPVPNSSFVLDIRHIDEDRIPNGTYSVRNGDTV